MTDGPAVAAGDHLARPDWLPADVWPWHARAVEIDGHRVAYTDEGQGPTLLLVNVGQWSIIWRDLVAGLRDRYRVVVPEFPPAGSSTLAAGVEPSLALHVRLLEGLAAALDLRGVVMVAHDLGGLVGFGWAARQPDRVRALVAVNTFAWPPERRGLRAMLRVMSSAPVTALDVATNAVMRLTSSRQGVGRHLEPAARRAVVAGFGRPARRAFHHLLRDALTARDLQEEVLGGLGTVLADRPLLTVYGSRNDPFGFQDRWAALFPTARHEVVDGGNHFPMCDAPQDVVAWLDDWLGGTGCSPPG